jgi:hypothetical protein
MATDTGALWGVAEEAAGGGVGDGVDAAGGFGASAGGGAAAGSK